MIDAHLHVWTLDVDKYAWQPTLPTVPIPKEPATIETFVAAMDSANVTNAVLVQTSVYGWDNRYLCDGLERYPKRFAGICLVDPRSEHAADDLRHWCEGRGCQGLRINTIAQTEAGWLLESAMTRLWNSAADLGASISFQIDPGHADAVNALARRRPEITFIVDCIAAKVYHEANVEVVVETLAEQPNVFLKLVSFGQDSREPYPFRDLWPFFGDAVAKFGPERMVFGTDFPHVLAACSYSQAVAWLDELPFVDAAARTLISEGTARELWKFHGN